MERRNKEYEKSRITEGMGDSCPEDDMNLLTLSICLLSAEIVGLKWLIERCER